MPMNNYKKKTYLFCASLSCIAKGDAKADINQKRLRPSHSVVDRISNTEILSSAMPIMIPGEDKVGSDLSSSSTCASPSARWLREQVKTMSDVDLSNFFDWHVYTLPFAYKLLVEQGQNYGQEYFGLDGEYNEEINTILEHTQDFWSNSGVHDDIRVLGAHGSDLADRHNKLIPTLQVLFSESYDDEYTVFDHATDIQDLIARLPGGYNYPLLTFNAFATDKVDHNGSPSIIIGDGYFEFQQAVGLGSEGPEYALTHEHAHHLQFALLHVSEVNANSAQTARRQELMADGFSAYFLAHNHGGQMTADELSNIHEIAFSVGDCEVQNDTRHHGTPEQRKCATRWGATLAISEGAADLDLVELKDRFDTWYERVDALEIFEVDCQSYASSESSPSFKYQIKPTLQLFIILYGVSNMLLES